MHKGAAEGNMSYRTHTKRFQIAKTNFLTLDISVGDYAMISVHAEREHKL